MHVSGRRFKCRGQVVLQCIRPLSWDSHLPPTHTLPAVKGRYGSDVLPDFPDRALALDCQTPPLGGRWVD